MNQFQRFQAALKLENVEDNIFLVNPDTGYFCRQYSAWWLFNGNNA